jgi:hypothetical protein
MLIELVTAAQAGICANDGGIMPCGSLGASLHEYAKRRGIHEFGWLRRVATLTPSKVSSNSTAKADSSDETIQRSMLSSSEKIICNFVSISIAQNLFSKQWRRNVKR